MSSIRLYTIGFTQKPAERFFAALRAAGIRRVLDVRLHNVSQLAGFAKRDDLRFFLGAIGGIEYVPMPELAPTAEMLDSYRKKRDTWEMYERRFLDLMAERRIEDRIAPESLDDGCLLCSEDKPHRCHRRLVAEYLRDRWGGNLAITHIG